MGGIIPQSAKFADLLMQFLLLLLYCLLASYGALKHGGMSEWLKEHDWKSCVRENRT